MLTITQKSNGRKHGTPPYLRQGASKTSEHVGFIHWHEYRRCYVFSGWFNPKWGFNQYVHVLPVALIMMNSHVIYIVRAMLRKAKLTYLDLSPTYWKRTRYYGEPIVVWTWIPREDVMRIVSDE